MPLTIRPLEETARRRRRRRPARIPLNPAGLTGIDPAAYPGSLMNGNGLTRELVSWFPKAEPGGIMLDMGSGDRRCEPVLRLAGHEYVSMDIAGDEPHVLGIGEALPFRDESFDFLFTLSVVPHTAHPLVVMREIHRVLRPGGRYVGTMEFLEPCHMQSRHHVTALGVQDWIDFSGFELVELEAQRSPAFIVFRPAANAVDRVLPRSARRSPSGSPAAFGSSPTSRPERPAPVGRSR